MVTINLRRMTVCNQCDRPAPVPGNAKQYGDERDAAVLCRPCETYIRNTPREVAATWFAGGVMPK